MKNRTLLITFAFSMIAARSGTLTADLARFPGSDRVSQTARAALITAYSKKLSISGNTATEVIDSFNAEIAKYSSNAQLPFRARWVWGETDKNLLRANVDNLGAENADLFVAPEAEMHSRITKIIDAQTNSLVSRHAISSVEGGALKEQFRELQSQMVSFDTEKGIVTSRNSDAAVLCSLENFAARLLELSERSNSTAIGTMLSTVLAYQAHANLEADIRANQRAWTLGLLGGATLAAGGVIAYWKVPGSKPSTGTVDSIATGITTQHNRLSLSSLLESVLSSAGITGTDTAQLAQNGTVYSEAAILAFDNLTNTSANLTQDMFSFLQGLNASTTALKALLKGTNCTFNGTANITSSAHHFAVQGRTMKQLSTGRRLMSVSPTCQNGNTGCMTVAGCNTALMAQLREPSTILSDQYACLSSFLGGAGLENTTFSGGISYVVSELQFDAYTRNGTKIGRSAAISQSVRDLQQFLNIAIATLRNNSAKIFDARVGSQSLQPEDWKNILMQTLSGMRSADGFPKNGTAFNAIAAVSIAINSGMTDSSSVSTLLSFLEQMQQAISTVYGLRSITQSRDHSQTIELSASHEALSVSHTLPSRTIQIIAPSPKPKPLPVYVDKAVGKLNTDLVTAAKSTAVEVVSKVADTTPVAKSRTSTAIAKAVNADGKIVETLTTNLDSVCAGKTPGAAVESVGFTIGGTSVAIPSTGTCDSNGKAAVVVNAGALFTDPEPTPAPATPSSTAPNGAPVA